MLGVQDPNLERLVQLLFLIQNGKMLRKGSIEPDLDSILLDGQRLEKFIQEDFSISSEHIVGKEERRLSSGRDLKNMLKKIN